MTETTEPRGLCQAETGLSGDWKVKVRIGDDFSGPPPADLLYALHEKPIERST